MKKIVVMTLALFCLIGILAGCGSVTQGSLNGTYIADDGEYSITFKTDGTFVFVLQRTNEFLDGNYEKDGELYTLYIRSERGNQLYYASVKSSDAISIMIGNSEAIFYKAGSRQLDVAQQQQQELLNSQKDASAMTEVAHAIELALADEIPYDEVVSRLDGNNQVIFSFVPNTDGIITVANALDSHDFPTLLNMLRIQIGERITLTSQEYKNKTYNVAITMNPGAAVTVYGSWD